MVSLFLSLPSGVVSAQAQYRFDQMTAEQGFQQSIAFHLAQDTVGNLWVTTEEGVLRFNSSETYNYSPGIGLPAGFGESIRTVHVGPSGSVWIGGERGVARYIATIDEFELLPAGQAGPRLVKDLVETPKGDLWIAGFNGLWRYDPKTDETTRMANLRNLETLLLENNTLLFGVSDGLYFLNLLTGEWAKTKLEITATAIAKADGGYLIGGQKGQLFLLSEDFKTFIQLDEYGALPIRAMERSGDGDWFVATDGAGIHVYDSAFQKKNNYRSDVDNLRSLSSDGVYDLLTDREGILWVATYGGGVNKLDPYGNVFRHLTHVPNTEQSLAHPFTRAVLEDGEGRIWFGTKDGISIWDRSTGRWSHLLQEVPDRSRQIVTSLTEQGENVWATTFQGGLFRIRKRDFQVAAVPFANAEDERQGRIFTSALDEDGYLWIGGVNMDVYQIGSTGTVNSFPVQQVKVISAVPGGGVLVGSKLALNQIKATKGGAAGAKINSLEALDVYRKTKDFSSINAILPLANGIIYLGTSGAGLLRYDVATQQITSLTVEDGLPVNVVQSLLSDAKGHIWAGTSRGLARVEMSESDTLVRVFTKAEGLLSTEFNYGSAVRLRDGEMLFGGLEGVSMFNPASVKTAGTTPTVVLEDLFLFNERQAPGSGALPAHINTLDRLDLTYSQNALTFHFAGIAHASSGRVRYRWQLRGLDDRWSKPSTLNQINFTNLKPGSYVFRVEAATRPGDWGPTKELLIGIAQPWWKTWWARLVYLLLAVVAAYAAFRVSRALIRRRNAERQIDFFNNITHELKTPLAILLASLEDVTETTDQVGTETNRKIRATIKRLNSLFEQLLNFHKASSSGKSRHVVVFTPGDRARELTTRFGPLLMERELTLSVNDTYAPPRLHYDQDIFDKIVFNLVSNAVKYSRPGGSITVELGAAPEGQLELKVSDTGIGIPADQQKYILREYYRARNAINSQLPGTGLGLMMVKSMVEKEGGSIRFSSKENQGTTFYVMMEDRKADYKPAITDKSVVPLKVEIAEETAELKSAHILLVEDNDELRAQLSKRLSKFFKVTTAANGKEGLEKAAEIFPDLILTDLIMPEMDGMEMSRAIQADIQLNHIPIYLLTVLHNSAQKVESIAAGVTEYLEKPVNFDLLLAKITNTLSWRKRMRERYAAQDEADRADQHRSDRESEFIGSLEEFMLSNIANDSLSVQDLCRHVGMSRTSLYMKMKNLIDLSPQDFIIHTRLKASRRMLAETDETVKGVAYECGFSNPKYFSTSFKKKYGMSPVAFRKSLV
ncbi:two-component regulator propeller domain-containing protein [Neolewinella persica]|uniref:two-component regulator propeller domain-containing protein n=1 Tax=Neolewinella persica TaxID=70998 RepID=UPI0003A8C63B|nr:two-component regulator propeller domain-containing protein [Neolewinella persica]